MRATDSPIFFKQILYFFPVPFLSTALFFIYFGRIRLQAPLLAVRARLCKLEFRSRDECSNSPQCRANDRGPGSSMPMRLEEKKRLLENCAKENTKRPTINHTNGSRGKKNFSAHRGARTHDHKVKSLALYRLS